MNQDEKKKIYGALAAPFPEHAIQRTEGRVTGRGYDTAGIGYQFICNRLNEVLGVGGWRAHRTVTVKEIMTSKGRPAFEAICDLTLELGSWENGDFVVFAEALADGGHTNTSEADARKGAYTNALKKAAAMFGCGRQAYEGSLDDDNVLQDGEAAVPAHAPPATPAPVTERTVATAAPPVVQSLPTKPSSPPRSRLTSKQLAAIWAIARKLGYEQQALRQMVKAKFNTQPEFLTRDQASALIGSLAQEVGNGHADEMRQPGEEG